MSNIAENAELDFTKIMAKLLISNLFFYTNNNGMRSSCILLMNLIQILRIVIYLQTMIIESIRKWIKFLDIPMVQFTSQIHDMPATPKFESPGFYTDLVGCAGFWNLDSLVQHWVRRDCLEAYHVECVAKDESFVESGNSWTCTVCEHRIATAKFARVRRNKGFCNHYLKNLHYFGKRIWMSTLMGTTNPITTRRGKIRMSEGKGVVMKRVVKSNGKGVVTKRELKSKGKGVVMKRVVKSKGKGAVMKRGLKSKGKGVVMKTEVQSKGKGVVMKREFLASLERKILCDERLKSVLGQKTVYRNQMCDLLQPHFIENLESSDEDELGLSSEAEDENVMVACKKQRELITNRKSPEKEVVINAPQSCFASIVSENVTLVYLKRSLVQGVLKQPETFENKLIGSFVRVKLDPNDSIQRNSHQLVQVTVASRRYLRGITIHRFSSRFQICQKTFASACFQMFSSLREECEDLSQKVKDGLLKKPTIVDIELKARSLHEDITKHGMEKSQLLQKPSEQSRLLQVVPKVIADVSELETMANDAIKENKQGDESLPKSILLGSSAISGDSSKGSGFSSVAKKKRSLASIIEELDRLEPKITRNQEASAVQLTGLSSSDDNDGSRVAIRKQKLKGMDTPVWRYQ
ncbi:unnamed protein product [Camellia sinensis]